MGLQGDVIERKWGNVRKTLKDKSDLMIEEGVYYICELLTIDKNLGQ